MKPSMNRMRWAAVLVLAGLLGATVPSARAQSGGDLSRDPGYVDMAFVERWIDTEASIEVNIRGALLRLVASASEAEDPELARLLRRLKAIQVRGYPLHGTTDYRAAEDHAARLADRLRQRDWDTVLSIRETGERVDMYVKAGDEAIAGLVVFVVDAHDGESVFINIVGEIDPEEIGRIGRKFNIGSLDGVANDSH